MQIFRRLYLTDRTFYLLGACVALCFASFSYVFVFYMALLLLAVTGLLTITDIYLLFKKQLVSAERRVGNTLSLGEENPVGLVLSSLSDRDLYIRLIDEIPYQFNIRDFSADLALGPAQSQDLKYYLNPPQRGEYRFGDIHLFVKTRIGLAAKKETSPAAKPVAVYPSIMQMGRQELQAFRHPSFMQGVNKSRRRGQSYEFDQLKQYVPGDDPRHINWKASSTMGEIIVNHYEDERSQQIYAVIDKSRVMKMPFNGLTLLDYAVNASLAFANIVLKKQDKAGLIFFSKTAGTLLKADRGPLQLKKILYKLYKEKYDYAEASYESLYSSIRHNIPNRSLLMLYTNFDSIYALERSMPMLRLINSNHLLVVIFFENTELEAYSKTEADSLMDIYQIAIAKKLILEKKQIYRELLKNGIQAVQSTPAGLSAAAINKYLELKDRGLI